MCCRPDEAGKSTYKMQHVEMSPSGIPVAIQGHGRLPEARTPPPPTPVEGQSSPPRFIPPPLRMDSLEVPAEEEV